MGLDYKRYDCTTIRTPISGLLRGAGPEHHQPVYGQIRGRPLPYLVNADTFQQLGLYAQDQIKLTDRLTLVLGGRQDFANNVCARPADPGQQQPAQRRGVQRPRRPDLQPPRGPRPYVSYSTSFQPQIGSDINGRSFAPEYGEQIEIGAKFEPIGSGFFLTVAAFDLVRQNVLQPLPGTFFNTQIGEVRSRGVEVQAVANLAEGLNLVAAFTPTISRPSRARTRRSGERRPASPRCWPRCSPTTRSHRSLARLRLRRRRALCRALLRGRRQHPDGAGLRAVRRAGHYTWDNWRAAINASNIADRRFVSSCISVNECFYGEARGARERELQVVRA